MLRFSAPPPPSSRIVAYQLFASDALRCVGLLATFQCILVGLVAECLLLLQHWEAYAAMLFGLFIVLVVSFLKGYRIIAAIHASEAAGY